MPVNTDVCKPERIENLAELEDILKRIDLYREEYVPNAREVGVLMMQTRQFGALYVIRSKEHADKEMNKPVFDDGKGNRTCEWGIKFYPRSYFEELREKLNGNGQKDYS